MNFVSYTLRGQPGYGVAQGDELWSLNHRFSQTSDLKTFIAQDLLDEARDVVRHEPPDAALSEVALELPIPNPGKILCVGVNYAKRNEEYDDSRQAPYPSLFMRTPDSLVPHGGMVLIPPESEQLDYEGEIVLVVGQGGRRIPETEAMQRVFGYSLMNEGTLRDWLRHAKFNVTQGKNFDASGAFGPHVVPRDAVTSPSDIRLQTFVNDELRQDASTADLIYGFPKLISYISSFSTLHPGDLIATGTPTGAGARFDPPRYLKPGDQVRVRATAIGELECRVAAEAV